MKSVYSIKRRFLFFIISIIVSTVFISEILSEKLFPIVLKYGEYQCSSVATKIINYVVSNQVSEELKDKIVSLDEKDFSSMEFNTSVLNSISSNAIREMQKYLYLLENELLDEQLIVFLGLNVDEKAMVNGIVYEVPFSRVFSNVLLNQIGLSFPVKYKLIGDLSGKIVSSIKEYGINNALLEINLDITMNSVVSVPMLSEENKRVISVPLVVRVIQGDIPDVFLGTTTIGEVM